MTDLSIIFGDRSVELLSLPQPSWVYRIGGVGPTQENTVSLNDAERLQKIALEIRQEYSEWIYAFNKKFSRDPGPVFKGSVFLLSDCSCKRTELFGTFNWVCNLLLLKDLIKEKSPTRIRVYGCDRQFLSSLKMLCPDIVVEGNDIRDLSLRKWRGWASDLVFFAKVVMIAILNLYLRRTLKRSVSTDRVFFTIFPKMFDLDTGDRKYGELVDKADTYLASILTDGFHQNVQITRYLETRSYAQKRGLEILDDYLTHADWIRGLIYLIPLKSKMRPSKEQCMFRGVDAYEWIQEEFRLSGSRLSRFVTIHGALKKWLSRSSFSEFVYYLHEYPLGRLISCVLISEKPHVKKIGYQHGPAAWAKMLYSLAPSESGGSNDLTVDVALPDEVIAEDRASAEIYSQAGYRSVRVSEKIWRLQYLNDLSPKRKKKVWLVAPGLHDGVAVLEFVRSKFLGDHQLRLMVKPHPLGDQSYLERFRTEENIVVTTKSISELLTDVEAVLVSYSSVGEEAQTLGISVYLIQIPGVVSESPLADRQPQGGWIEPTLRKKSSE